jgi:calmodulin
MASRFHKKYTYDELKQAFEFFDRDGSGYITKEELRLALNRLGKLCTEKELNAMISVNDDDGNGKISFDEFQKLLE